MITNKINDLVNVDYNNGEVLLIDKSPGITSFDAVYKVRKIIKVKKVGHAGTLDPAATGLLILCTGRKTKEISGFQNLSKTYSGIITVGKRTPSMDAETEVIEEKDFTGIIDKDIYKTRDMFLGKSLQLPPMYSALKHKGKALYKYARKGIEIKREPREIFITRFEINKINLPDIHFEIECSKGTYIRVVADDFGKLLGCGALLKKLRRTGIGEYSVDDALTLDKFEQLNETRVLN